MWRSEKKNMARLVVSIILVSVLITSLFSHSLTIVMGATTNATAQTTTNATAQTTTNATGTAENNATKSQPLSQVAKLNKQGEDLIVSGKYNESIAYFDKVLAFDPNYVYALLGKGFSLFKLGSYNESIVYLDKVLSIDPKNSNALIFKTLAHAALNKSSNISKGSNVVQSKNVSPQESNNTSILKILIP